MSQIFLRAYPGRVAVILSLVVVVAAADICTTVDEPDEEDIPAQLAVLSGCNQTGPAGGALPSPVIVEVRNSGGVRLSAVEVQFQVSAGGGTTSPASADTNSSGSASTTWTLGPSGTQSLRISVPGGSAPVATCAATIG